MVDTVCKTIEEESRPARFGRRIGIRVQETRPPETIRLLQLQDTGTKLDEQLLVEGAVLLVLFWKDAQDFHQSAYDPTIPPAPKHLLAVRFLLSDVAMVSIEKMRLFIEEMLVGLFVFLIHEAEVGLIAGQCIEPGIHRRRHKEGIAPCPTF